MILENNDFFNFSDKNDNIFSTNIKSVLGRNIVLNFIQGMDFELKMFNFSETANDIAKFYEQNKTKGCIYSFFENDVIKMIIDEIQKMPNLKRYLNERIFDLIEEDKKEVLQNIYDNNEKISTDVEKKENKYLYEQKKYQEAIKKIMEEKGVSEDNAKILYENKKLKKEMKKRGIEIPSFIDKVDNFIVEENPVIPVEIKNLDSQEITISDDMGVDIDFGNENFWS